MSTEIIEGNRAIAEFMEWTIEPSMENEENPYYNAPHRPGYIPAMFLLNDLRFHSSWDWLMPVVEKIEFEIGATVYRRKMICEIHFNDDINHFSTIKEEKEPIKALWLSVVEFIKWY